MRNDKSSILSNIDAPLTLSFTVTGMCNYRCRHCYNNSGDAIYNELSDDELLYITEQICELKPPNVCLCGGEPLIRGNIIFEIIKKLFKNCGVINIVSNGYLINNDTVTNLKVAGIKAIQISLDGNTEFLHNNLRMNIYAYKKAAEAIKCIVSANMDALVSFCPNKLNIHNFRDTCDLVYKLGAKEIRVMPLILMGRGTNMRKLAPTPDEYLLLQQEIEILKQYYLEKGFNISWGGDPLDHYMRMQTNDKKNIKTINVDIRSDGKLLLSTYLPIVLGDLKKHSLKEYWEKGYNKIWGNEKVKNYISNIYSTSYLSNFEPKPYSGMDIDFDIFEN